MTTQQALTDAAEPSDAEILRLFNKHEEKLGKGSTLFHFNEFARELLALHRPEQAEKGWQPIETAPKDGSVIWTFNGEQGRMHWTEGEIAGDRWALWVWDDQLLAEVDAEPDQPTHWMPLPPAPAIDSTKGAA